MVDGFLGWVKPRSKSFTISVYGYDEAFRLAAEARKGAIDRLRAEGVPYSESHGDQR